MNHDGPSSGLTVPNGLAQQALIRRALEAAGVGPGDVSYVEAHGTGTALGDPIEAEALGAVMGVDRPVDAPLLIGSVKTNIGHLEAAAGVAGLIKVVLALGHEELPAQLHFDAPSPHIRWDQLKLSVVDSLRPWTPINGRRIAGVSSFGFSGTNAHLVVEGPPAPPAAPPPGADRPMEILPLSARTATALRTLAARWRDRLQRPDAGTEWINLCHTAGVGRAAFAHKVSARAANAAAAKAALEAFLAGEPHPALVAGEARSGSRPRIGFLFTGQGSQYAGMGKALHAGSPMFRRIVERAEAALAGRFEVPLSAVMLGEHPEASRLINLTLYTQPALYVLEYGLAELWRSLGVEPAAVLGHSLGEYVGAAVAGMFSFEEGLALVAERGRLMHGIASEGAMMVVAASEAEVAPLLAGREAEASIAGVNAARQVTVSGARTAVEAIAAACAARGWRTHPLPVSQAFHSPLLDPIGAAFEARADAIGYGAPKLPVISNLTGKALSGADGAYWRAHMRGAVRFSDGLAAMQGLGCDVLLELGPRPVLIQLARQALGSGPGKPRCLASLRGPGGDEWDGLCQAAQELYAAGAELDWAGWSRDHARRKVDAPFSPFERRRHWIAPSAPKAGRGRAAGAPAGAHPLLGRRLRSALAGGQFEATLSAEETTWLADHRIAGRAILPATGFMEMMLAAGEAVAPGWKGLADLSILAPLRLPAAGGLTVQTVVDAPEGDAARVRVFAAEADADGVEAEGESRFRLVAEAWLKRGEGGRPDVAAFDLAKFDLEAADLEAARARCPRIVESEAHYRRLAERGASFGATFCGVRRIWAGEGEAVAEIAATLPGLAAGRPHPATLDACLQIAAAVLDGDDSFAPTTLERFARAAADWPDRVIALARLAKADPRAPEFDFAIHDPDGRCLAKLDRLRFQKIASHRQTQDVRQWIYSVQWRPMELASTQPTGRDAWAVVGAGEVAGALAARLRAAGKTVLCAEGAVELERALADRVGASGIVFAPAEGAIQDDGPMSAEGGTRALLALTRSHANQGLLTNCRLYVTTQSLHAVLPSDSIRLTDVGISGLAATIANEFADLQCTRIDVDPTDASEAAEEIAREALADTPESWVAWRKGRRFAARLQRADCGAEMGEGRVRLASDRGLDGLQWRPEEPRPLNAHEVEIEVRAAPLNFHDVASVVGLISDRSDLGGECAGVVTRVGPLTKRFRPGDAVVAMTPGSFATFAIAPDERVIPKPEGLSFESASAQGLVYLTADYSLNTVAKMQRGERVLIHAAAGGVGYAAVQLCMRAGVEVFATAGSDAKRAFLRELGVQHVFSSRTLDFAADIERITEGRGVDVILDCLAGAFIDAGLSLLRLGGRFVEIGKTDIRDPIAVAAARPGVVYTAVDLADRLRDEPEAMMRRLSALLESIAAGELHPAPHRTYDFRDAKAAFHDLAAARNIGKLVLAPRPAQPLVRAGGAYIVTGGASGLGFVVAEWLAGQGAARILLFGRRPPAPEVAARIAEWRKRGVDIAAHQGDVGQSDAVATLIAEAGPALRGVVHCANVLDDAPAGELTWERFATVLHAKAQGAWNLHHATIDLPLDFFVLFSSFASLAGTRGGANYAAANIALDSLAHLRRRQDLPALSLDWGVWGDVGWATRRPGGAVVAPGFRPMSSAQGVLAMEFALRNVRSPQVAIAPIDWPHLIGAMGHNVAPLWSDFATERGVVQGREPKTAESSLAATIAETSPEAAHASVLERLQRMAAVALGIDDPARIDPGRPLQDLGLDSILAIELRNTLAYSLGRPVPATVLFDHPTLLGLTDYCLSAIATELRQSAPPERPDDGEDLLALIESLSDEDVHARLLSRGFEIAE